jgi:hypothetical protein
MFSRIAASAAASTAEDSSSTSSEDEHAVLRRIGIAIIVLVVVGTIILLIAICWVARKVTRSRSYDAVSWRNECTLLFSSSFTCFAEPQVHWQRQRLTRADSGSQRASSCHHPHTTSLHSTRAPVPACLSLARPISGSSTVCCYPLSCPASMNVCSVVNHFTK